MRRIAIVFLSIVLFACASSQLERARLSEELPPEIPKELQDKFRVMEEPLPEPTPSASPTATKGKKTVARKSERKVVDEEKARAIFIAKHYPNRRPKVDPIWIGEKMVFDITWLGVSAGEFSLEALPTKYIAQRKVYHIQGRAKSSPVFSIFYKLDDMVETFVDFESFFTHRFHMTLDETKQTRDSLELHDVEKEKIFYWNRHNREGHEPSETKEFFDRLPLSQDTLSALYYARSVPLPNNGKVTFPVVSEGKTWEAELHVVRREEIRTPQGKMKAVVIRPETKFQGVLKKTGDSYIWLSDDDRRFLLRLEAKVKIGSVLAELKRIEPGVPPEKKD